MRVIIERPRATRGSKLGSMYRTQQVGLWPTIWRVQVHDSMRRYLILLAFPTQIDVPRYVFIYGTI